MALVVHAVNVCCAAQHHAERCDFGALFAVFVVANKRE